MKTCRTIHDKIKFAPAVLNMNDSTQEILLASGDLDRFLNVYVSKNGIGSGLCIVGEDAKRLRDLLIQAYPLPTFVTPEPATKAPPKGAQQYRGNGNHDWEEVSVDPKGYGYTYRLRAPGGWIYRTTTLASPNGTPVSTTSVFVPVPSAVGYAV